MSTATTYNPDLHMQIKTAIINGLIQLNLDQIETNVLDRIIQDPTNADFPAVMVVIEDDVEEITPGDTLKTDWWYPVSVYVVGRSSTHDTKEQEWMLRTRNLISKSYDQRALANLPVTVMYVTPRPIFNPEFQQYMTLISGMTIKVWATEYRVF